MKPLHKLTLPRYRQVTSNFAEPKKTKTKQKKLYIKFYMYLDFTKTFTLYTPVGGYTGHRNHWCSSSPLG